MSNFHERYKTNPGGHDLATGRMIRAGWQREQRKINRTDNFSRFRDVSSSPARPAPKKATLHLAARLQKWKLEKALKKQMEQLKKKPPFKVGVVHHRFYSPTVNDKQNSKSIPRRTRGARKVKIQPTPPKRITRATQKRLEAKNAAVIPAVLFVAGPSDSSIKSRNEQKSCTKKSLKCSLVPENYAFNVPSCVKKLPGFGRFAINRDDPVNNDSIRELRACLKTPWLTLNNIPKDPMLPQKMCNPFVRQAAFDMSSLSGSKDRCLSIDEASSETNDASKEAQHPKLSKPASRIRSNSASTIDSDTAPNKTPKVRSDDSLSYVDSDQTSGKGILKKSEETSSQSACSKSIPKVDFHDDLEPNEIHSTKELENSIDSYDSDVSDDVFEPTHRTHKNVTVRQRVKQRLDFENESFSETLDSGAKFNIPAEATKKFDIPALNIIEATPTAHLCLDRSIEILDTRSRRRNSDIDETVTEESRPEDNASIRRVLRNRKVPINTPNTSNRRSKKSGQKSTLDSSAKENDDPQAEEQKSNASELSKMVGIDSGNEGTIERRKSTRKSVRFNADDCTGCAGSYKPVHPMTPHSRKNRKVSLLGDDSRLSIVSLINGDLMSFDSPATTMVPPRVRRGSEMDRKTPKQ